MTFAFDPGEAPSLPIDGSSKRYPVHRIYCVGRNYADHAREMGGNPEREPPFFFAKPADAIVESGGMVPYPPCTQNLHHEIELVVAIGSEGANIALEDANAYIFGYAVGCDLTRRDLQFAARDAGRPWDTAKGFDYSAPITAIHRIEDTGILEKGRDLADRERRQAPDQQPGRDDLVGARDHRRVVEALHAEARRPDLHRHSVGCRPAGAGRRGARRRRVSGDFAVYRYKRRSMNAFAVLDV